MRLRKEEAPIEDRQMGGDDHVLRADLARRRFDHAGLTAVDPDGLRLLEDGAAVALHTIGEAVEVLTRMELRLALDPHGGQHGKGQVGFPGQDGVDSC